MCERIMLQNSNNLLKTSCAITEKNRKKRKKEKNINILNKTKRLKKGVQQMTALQQNDINKKATTLVEKNKNKQMEVGDSLEDDDDNI